LKKEKREQSVREPYFENPLFRDQQHLIVYRKKEDGKISPQNLIKNQMTKEQFKEWKKAYDLRGN